MKKLLGKLFKKDNLKEKMPLKLRIKNSFKKQWLKIVLSIIFIFISLLICALTAIDTKWITGASNEFNDFMNKQIVDFFGKFNSGIMLAGIFVFWWGGAIYFAIKFEKLIRLIIQKIKLKQKESWKMKSNKLINSLKKYWWRILPYIFMITIFFIPFLKLEINDLKLLYEKFEALISLMILGYLDICITIAVIINCSIEWFIKKIKTKRVLKNETKQVN